MKNLTLWLIIIVGTFLLVDKYKAEIIDFTTNFFTYKQEIVIPKANEYKKEASYLLVKNTNNFEPINKSDLINIYYTIINSGWNEFTFYCSDKYTNCLSDLRHIADDQILLSHINNFVHPFNSYRKIRTSYDALGAVTISIEKTYTENMIKNINTKVTEILNNHTNDEMTTEEKIRHIHDYIVNNTKYDSKRIDENNFQYQSDNSYGVLFQGYGICSGYADTMAIFLSRLNINNYKIASDKHVWNFLYLNDNWLHLDVVWDDPINAKEDILDHTYFLIDTKKLESLDIAEHKYDKMIYLEAQ